MTDTDLDPEVLQSRAYATKSFLGHKLEPFSFARQTAAQRLSMSSDSILEASALLVFLCLQPWESIDSARDVGMQPFRRKFCEWADANKIGLNTENGKLVRKIAAEIWEELAAADSEPVIAKARGPTGPKATRRAPKRNTSLASRQSSTAA